MKKLTASVSRLIRTHHDVVGISLLLVLALTGLFSATIKYEATNLTNQCSSLESSLEVGAARAEFSSIQLDLNQIRVAVARHRIEALAMERDSQAPASEGDLEAVVSEITQLRNEIRLAKEDLDKRLQNDIPATRSELEMVCTEARRLQNVSALTSETFNIVFAVCLFYLGLALASRKIEPSQ